MARDEFNSTLSMAKDAGFKGNLEEYVNLIVEKIELNNIEPSQVELEKLLNLCCMLLELSNVSSMLSHNRLKLFCFLIERVSIKKWYRVGLTITNKRGAISHYIHGLELAALELKLSLDSQVMNIDGTQFSILTVCCHIFEAFIKDFSSEENITCLEYDNISGIEINKLFDIMRSLNSFCIEFIENIEKMDKLTNNNEDRINLTILPDSNYTLDNNELPPIYWCVQLCSSILSKWFVLEPDVDKYQILKILPFISRYLNSMHFAVMLPTLEYIPITDWGCVPHTLEALTHLILSFISLISTTNNDETLTGLFSGLYQASILTASAWWSPSIDVYTTLEIDRNKSIIRELPRLYIKLQDNDTNYVRNSKSDKIIKLEVKQCRDIIPLPRNSIPAQILSNVPGISETHSIAYKIFDELLKLEFIDILLRELAKYEGCNRIISSWFSYPGTLKCEKYSAIIEALVCVVLILTCRNLDTFVPEKLWIFLYEILLKIAPTTSKGFLEDPPRQISLFISCSRALAIAISNKYQEPLKIIQVSNYKVPTIFTDKIPQLSELSTDDFSLEDDQVISFFRVLFTDLNIN
ncbi:hypothetical protein cand_026250 [Cryptosporidium andersoni]|uniref:Uncharacterized protein n=1 Tax=Cryptosporidium andersoni TaxID=117008 RepID=A0A1J4MAG3_9CRYT|nr:hypothetical protein cand_026250 [Cryptosporidium andersoni]